MREAGLEELLGTDAMEEAALVSELDARRHGGSKPSIAKQSMRTSRTSGVLVQT